MDNQIFLQGLVDADPVVSHRNHGVTYLQFPLSVPRLSGVADVLHIVVTEDMAGGVTAGTALAVEGEVRSFNNRTGKGSRLVITVLARRLAPSPRELSAQLTEGVAPQGHSERSEESASPVPPQGHSERSEESVPLVPPQGHSERSEESVPLVPKNELYLTGTLCKPPVLRRTPLGRDICDLMLAVNRQYGRTDYLPLIAWGSLAQRCGGYEVGDSLSLRGRLQSRTYQKVTDHGTEERTAFEVSVMELMEG